VSNVSDGAFVTNKVAGGGFLEMRVENAVETAGFIGVALDAVRDGFGGIAGKVVGLSLHWSNA